MQVAPNIKLHHNRYIVSVTRNRRVHYGGSHATLAAAIRSRDKLAKIPCSPSLHGSRPALLALVRTAPEPFDGSAVYALTQSATLSLTRSSISMCLSHWARRGWLALVSPGGRNKPSVYRRSKLPPEPAPSPDDVLPAPSPHELAWREFRATITIPERPAFYD